MPDLRAMIAESAAKYGVSPETLLRIAQLESGLNPQAANPSSSARGVFQFLTKPGGAWEQYGAGKDPFDPAANIDAGARLTRDNQALLRTKLGREPEPWEVYLTHQQGAAGGPALLANPQRPAADVLRAFYKDPTKAIVDNAGDMSMTAGDFANLWKARFEGSGAQAAGGGVRAPSPLPSGRVEPPVNPMALAYRPNMASIFADTFAPLAKQPEELAVRKPRGVGNMIGDLGAPVRLSG